MTYSSERELLSNFQNSSFQSPISNTEANFFYGETKGKLSLNGKAYTVGEALKKLAIQLGLDQEELEKCNVLEGNTIAVTTDTPVKQGDYYVYYQQEVNG